MGALGGVFFQNRVVSSEPILKIADAFLATGLGHKSIWPDDRESPDPNMPLIFGQFHLTESSSSKIADSPYFDENSRLAIVADARIDGRSELIHQLEIPQRFEQELDDRDLILKAYRKWGEACPQFLIGDYAFAIWDADKQLLFCARDHIGARPFFYQHAANRFTFASDIRAILTASEETCEFDEDYVARSQLCGNFYSKKRTYYEGVEKLPPGHSLTVSDGRSILRQYWHPEKVAPVRYANDEDYAEALRELLGKAISDRIRTDRKLAVHISGGLDSSTIAALAIDQLQTEGRDKPIGLSWQPPASDTEEASAEHSWIKAISDHKQIEVHHIVPDAEGLYAMYQRDGTCEPCGRTLLNEDAVQRHAVKNNVGVILSGWGGDQLISNGGRSYFPQLFLTGRWIKLFQELRHLERHRFRAFWTLAVLPTISPALLYIYADWKVGKPVRLRKNRTFIHPDFAARMRPTMPDDLTFHSVKKSQIEQLEGGLLTRRLEAWGANARPHGIEYRYPLLDRRIVEFALAIPGDQFRRGKWSRWIFRNTMRDILPPEVCWNKTKSETVRVDALFQPFSEMVDRIRKELGSGQLTTTRSQYVDVPKLIKFIEPDSFKASKAYGPVQNALKFLDLG